MKIKEIQLLHVKLPMRYPFKTGFGTIDNRETLIVRLTSSEGVVGYGESAALTEPIYLSETISTCQHVIRDCIAPRIKGRNLNIKQYLDATSDLKEHQIAKFGVECAIWMILSKLKGVPLTKLLGSTRSQIEIGESIGILPTIKQTLQVIDKRLTQGYKRIKLKIHPGWDLKLLSAVRHQYPDIVLMVDANSSYTLNDLPLFQELDRYHLLMIEQPLGYSDLLDHAKLQSAINTPICLDESITSYDQARYAIELKSCRIINIKPRRVGGLSQVIKINRLAKEHHIPLWCGGMLESDIGKAYNLLAASLSEFTLPADSTTTGQFYSSDLTQEGIHFTNGVASLSTKPGLGYTVDQGNLKKYSINQEIIKL